MGADDVFFYFYSKIIRTLVKRIVASGAQTKIQLQRQT